MKRNKIENRKKEIGSRNDRKLRKYSNKFNEMFLFFLYSYRKGILTFSGSNDFKTLFDSTKECGKECFRKFDNGQYTIRYENGMKEIKDIHTKHNNILFCVIKGKKSWGLSVKEWSMGISECNFTIDEILKQFTDVGIIVPEPLIKELENNVSRMKKIRNKNELERIMKI